MENTIQSQDQQLTLRITRDGQARASCVRCRLDARRRIHAMVRLSHLGTRTGLSEIAAIDCQCHADDEGCSIRAQPNYRVCNLFRVA